MLILNIYIYILFKYISNKNYFKAVRSISISKCAHIFLV
jgi:hypothetical protein